ncbi:phage regulatory protein, Rha family [Desulfatibacillum aliphaticivorans]|uniref:Phage regulatory protein, Rha family n=1 Tax=Desulfatibacillum aliphaticivorans TaxID=218208 RepID=B8FB36_DESAL|nr:Rha family transcriptional regulator [Desulfatibacillum aliphaticivorans]ACL04122.1 phage regulatory protein, Rha family [Desulfatibacillum aliphaticivorans]
MNKGKLKTQGSQTTTSLIVADKFGKRHANVIQTIRNLEANGCPREFNELNFKLVNYWDAKGEQRPMYQITRDGFMMLAMGFTGKKAMGVKVQFIKAFNAMEALCRHLADPLWLTCRDQTKQARDELASSIKDFVEHAFGQGSKGAGNYYSNTTRMIYKALFPGQYSANIAGGFRDTLSTPELEYLASAEHVAAKALDEGIQEGLPHKEIYSQAKDRIQMFTKSSNLTYQEFNLGAPTLELPFAPAEDF